MAKKPLFGSKSVSAKLRIELREDVRSGGAQATNVATDFQRLGATCSGFGLALLDRKGSDN